jgi:hypothetical protein
VGQELLQHWTTPRFEAATLPGAVACERCKPRFIQMSGTEAMPIQPAIQVSKQPEFIPGVNSAVALFEKKRSKLVDVAS